MQVGQERFGMQTMNQSLASLHLRRLISLEDAIGRSSDPDELRNLIGKGGGTLPGARPAAAKAEGRARSRARRSSRRCRSFSGRRGPGRAA
jgi:twitching motility protein PilT